MTITPLARSALNDSIERARQLGLELPRIQVNGRELRDISSDALQALAKTEQVFVRSGELVRVVVDENGVAKLQTINEAAMRGILARAADFVVKREKRDRGQVAGEYDAPVSPPIEIVRDILNLGEWEMPAIEGVISSPIMRADGSILSQAGYDASTRLFYQPAPDFVLPDIPNHPDRKAIETARDKLLDVLADFPFDSEASRDNTIAAMVTLAARQMIAGAVPAIAADSPQQGTGKTLLTSAIVEIAAGENPEMSPAPNEAEEWRKTITAKLSNGRTAVIFDNLTGRLEDASLAAVLTSTTWSDRVLGTQRTISLPARCVFLITGNNIRVGGDLVTRVMPIRLDAKTSRPQERDGFRHPDLANYIRQNRAVLLAALLTMCHAWVAAGKPETTCPRMRYAAWRGVVGGILEYAGFTSFLGNLHQFWEEADDDTPVWEAFIGKLASVFAGGQAVTPGQIYTRLAANEELADCLPDSLRDKLGTPDDERAKNKFSQALGYELRARRGKRFGDSQAHIEKGSRNTWRFMVDV
jgi:hypothetical protein